MIIWSQLVEDEVVGPQSLVIQEGSDGISLKPFSDTDKAPPEISTSGKLAEQGDIKVGIARAGVECRIYLLMYLLGRYI